MQEISLLRLLQDRFGINPRPLRSPYEHLGVAVVDLADVLLLPGSAEAILFSLSADTELDADTAAQLGELIQARGYRDRFKFLEYTQASQEGIQVVDQIPGLSIFSRFDLGNLKRTAPLNIFLTSLVAQKTPLTVLNPYTYQGPVTGIRFFGRDHELATIRLQTNGSFVLSGARKSGKTSIMMELARRIQRSQDTKEIFVFVNFEVCQKLSDVPYLVLRSLADQLRTDSPELTVWGDNLRHLASSRQWENPGHLAHLGATLWDFSKVSSHGIRFLFDEYDRVLSLERPYDQICTRIWRDLWMRSRMSVPRRRSLPTFIQFIFAGSRHLNEQLLSIHSPFFNLGTRLALPNFDLATISDLISRPLRTLGVAIQDIPTLAQSVLGSTGGHPATTQHLLSLLVAEPQVESSRAVTLADVHRAASRQEFLGFLRETLEVNISPLGRFILAQIVINRRARVNKDFIHGVGRKYKLQFDDSSISLALQDLADSGYLMSLGFTAGQSVYKLAVPVVQNVFATDDIPYLVREMLADGACMALSRG